ncbi:hypothetical protein [Natrinema soli]|uniref:Uncharacterized protein n=1 Tax=Natrinema soli TaxID=1930624 RepID=A0ABD5SJZ8_9EURY|nr:hypothetical protein [Natrinema soli]
MSNTEETLNQSTSTGQQATEYRFSDWVACPKCDERDDVSTLSHKTEMVFECHECGLISEFVIGEDIPLQNLDANAIAELSDK